MRITIITRESPSPSRADAEALKNCRDVPIGWSCRREGGRGDYIRIFDLGFFNFLRYYEVSRTKKLSITDEAFVFYFVDIFERYSPLQKKYLHYAALPEALRRYSLNGNGNIINYNVPPQMS
jgi:hypothetical protein